MPELTAVCPELDRKALLQRVKGQVATGALRVVVGAGELGAGRLEATAGDGGWVRGGAESCTGEHLERSARASIGVSVGVLWRYVVSGEVERPNRCEAHRSFNAAAELHLLM
jgi:hypothetical protein